MLLNALGVLWYMEDGEVQADVWKLMDCIRAETRRRLPNTPAMPPPPPRQKPRRRRRHRKGLPPSEAPLPVLLPSPYPPGQTPSLPQPSPEPNPNPYRPASLEEETMFWRSYAAAAEASLPEERDVISGGGEMTTSGGGGGGGGVSGGGGRNVGVHSWEGGGKEKVVA